MTSTLLIQLAAGAVVDLAVAIAVFAKFHGHGPLDALAPAFSHVGAVVLLRGGFCEGLVGGEECFFEIFGFGIEGERSDDLTGLAILVGDDDLNPGFRLITSEDFPPGAGISFEIVVKPTDDFGIVAEGG